MSVDTTIAVLWHLNDSGKRVARVICAQAVDQIDYLPDYGGYNRGIIIDYFGESPEMEDANEINKLCEQLEQDHLEEMGIPTEYGRWDIYLELPFPK